MSTNNNQIDKDNSAKTQNVAKLNLTRFFFPFYNSKHD